MNDVKVLEGALSRSMTIRAVKCVVTGSPTLKRVTEGRRPKDRSEPQGTTALTTPPLVRAGYDCRNNTTSLRRPEAVGWAPSVLAGPLTTSLRGLWVSGLLQPGNGGTNERGGDPKADQVTQGADSQLPGWHPKEKATLLPQ